MCYFLFNSPILNNKNIRFSAWLNMFDGSVGAAWRGGDALEEKRSRSSTSGVTGSSDSSGSSSDSGLTPSSSNNNPAVEAVE